jgi:hypothetical protein
MKPGKPAQPLADRFWAKVKKTKKCWWWHGCQTGGYDRIIIGSRTDSTRRSERASRIALMLKLGRDLRPGFFACHTCDNPLCVRPSHLYEGTQAQNSQDCVKRGRYNKPSGKNHWTSRANSSPWERRTQKQKGLI